LTRALDKLSNDFRYKLNGTTIPISVFADDNMLPLQIRSIQDLNRIHKVFEDFHKVSGLKVNLKKTEIFALNTDPEILQIINRQFGIIIVDKVTYLGVMIWGGFEDLKKASYDRIEDKIKEKCAKIRKSYASMLHKR
jgi:Reverse transcriptase (RNA-dependent DNA polymerase)